MNIKTTLLLLVMLALLGGGIWWQKQTEVADRDVDVALFGDIDVSQVRRIRIDNIERSFNLRLESDSSGVWYMTDPISYPADVATVRALLEDVSSARALVLPKDQWDAKALGFDPPRIVIEVEAEGDEGVEVCRVEIGAPDMDRIRLNVRVGDRYLQGLVRLYTTLNHILDDFRSRKVMTLVGEEVIEVHRSGSVQFEVDEEPQDLEMNAILDGQEWRALSPRRALLGGLDAGVLVYGASRLRARSFVLDEEGDLAPYGLDRPVARIDLKTARGLKETLLLGRRDMQGSWYVKRLEAPFVWSIEPQSALSLLYPTEEMYDRIFMRALRRDVSSLRLLWESSDPLAGPSSELLVEASPDGWTVRGARNGAALGPALPADERRVEDVLARLEGLELGLFPADVPQPLPAELADGPRLDGAILLQVGNETLGGRFGRVASGDLARAGLIFRRAGDEVLYVAEDWMEELIQTPIDEFRAKDLVRLMENRLTGLSIRSEEKSKVFERDSKGIWHEAGQSSEAKQLLPLLDPLIFLKAQSFEIGEAEMSQVIELRFERFEAEPLVVRLAPLEALDEDPRTLAEVGGALSILKVGGLYRDLEQLLDS